MCMVIPLKSVVANAFIELREKEPNENRLSFEQMEVYRRKLIMLMFEKGEIIAIPCSGYDVSGFLNEYSDLFELKDSDSKPYIHLKDNKGLRSVDDLLMDFNACLPLKFLEVVFSRELKNHFFNR